MFYISNIYVVWHSIYLVVIVPTIVGNLLIIMSILKFPKLQSTMNILVANLAIADLIVGALLIPFDFFVDITGINSNKYFCLGKYAIFVLSLGGSCFNLLLISVERFIAVVFPLKKNDYFTRTRIILMITIGWGFSLADSLLPLLGWNGQEGNITTCVPDHVWTNSYDLFNGWLIITAYILNVTFYAVVMYIAVRKATTELISGNMRVQVNRKKDLKNLKTMILILGLFAICWFPYICMSVVITFDENPHTLFIRRCTLIPGLVNSSLNWLVYGYRNQDFRKAFWILLVCKRFRTKRNSENSRAS